MTKIKFKSTFTLVLKSMLTSYEILLMPGDMVHMAKTIG